MYQKTERSAQHGMGTPHGRGTPHRLPNSSAFNYTDVFEGLSRQLYPTGRAFWMKKNGVFDRLHKGINRSFIRLLQAGFSTIDSLFPDNDSFSADDASLWEYRLGLTTNETLPLSTRKEAIARKMMYPGNVKARQHRLFIEKQLQLAGFDVYVHENIFYEGGELVYKTPADIVYVSLDNTQHGGSTQHGGGTQHGSLSFEVIANEAKQTPEIFAVGSGIWATFFIGGVALGDSAEVPFSRIVEFKELVLKLKPKHTVAFTFINYT